MLAAPPLVLPFPWMSHLPETVPPPLHEVLYVHPFTHAPLFLSVPPPLLLCPVRLAH